MLYSITVATRSNYAYSPPLTYEQYHARFKNFKNCMCYTYSNNTMYKPHSAKGIVGTSSLGSLATRNRI